MTIAQQLKSPRARGCVAVALVWTMLWPSWSVALPPSDTPRVTARLDTATTREDHATVIDVLANDGPTASGSGQLPELLSAPTKGRALVQPDGHIIYTPSADVYGVDTFVYRVFDDAQRTWSSAHVVVAITPQPDAPRAQDDSFVLQEDARTTLRVLANDTHPDGKSLTLAIIDAPEHGHAQVHEGGTITYTPSAHSSGPDALTYRISDDVGRSATARVALSVVQVNDAPLARKDHFTVIPTLPSLLHVLQNDLDEEDDPLTVSIERDPRQGVVVVEADGRLRYTPTPGFTGTDSLSYRVQDPQGLWTRADVDILVSSTNRAPRAQDDAVVTQENTSVIFDARDNDDDAQPLSVAVSKRPGKGRATILPDGRIHYTPNAHASGLDELEYRVQDGLGAQSTARVAITISPLNDPPEAKDDDVVVSPDAMVRVHVLDNDVDLDDLDTHTVQLEGLPTRGHARVLPDQSIEYIAPAGLVSAQQIVYRVTDQHGAWDTGALRIRPRPQNLPRPWAQRASSPTQDTAPGSPSAPRMMASPP